MANHHRLYRRTFCGQWPVYCDIAVTVPSMLLNHVILPIYQTKEPAQVQMNIYRWLTNVKRLIIATLILGCLRVFTGYCTTKWTCTA